MLLVRPVASAVPTKQGYWYVPPGHPVGVPMDAWAPSAVRAAPAVVAPVPPKDTGNPPVNQSDVTAL